MTRLLSVLATVVLIGFLAVGVFDASTDSVDAVPDAAEVADGGSGVGTDEEPPLDGDTVAMLLQQAQRQLEAGQHGAAAQTFVTAARTSPVLSDWAWLWAANAAAAGGDSALVRVALDSTAADLRERYAFAAELASRERLDGAAAREALDALLQRQSDADRRARVLLALAEASRGGAGDAFALRALETAESSSLRADAASQLRPTIGSVAEARRAGDALLERGRVAEAVGWLDRRDVRASLSAAERDRLDLAIGRAYFNARLYPAAATRLELLERRAGGSESLFLLGRSEYRAGRSAEGRAHLLEVTRRYPNTTHAVSANHLLGDLAQDRRDYAAARRHFEAARTGNSSAAEAGLAWMRLAAMEFALGRHAEAARLYDEYRTRYPTGRRVDEATYWAGRSYAAMGRDSIARSRWQKLREPLSYYTHLSAARLGRPAPGIASGESTPAVQPMHGATHQRLRLLRRFGTPAEGTFEASRITDKAGAARAARLRLAATLIDAGWTIQGIRLARDVQQSDGRASTETLRLIYPFPYRDAVEREARANGLDPMFVAALIRQESLWDSRATSPVGARGLMQIMPSTGRDLAAVGARWDPDMLYEPETSIRLGTRFLRDLKAQTGGRAVDVLAGYNAGPHRIDRWREFPEAQDPELLAERIPFEETRHYVKVIQANQRIYRILYGG